MYKTIQITVIIDSRDFVCPLDLLKTRYYIVALQPEKKLKRYLGSRKGVYQWSSAWWVGKLDVQETANDVQVSTPENMNHVLQKGGLFHLWESIRLQFHIISWYVSENMLFFGEVYQIVMYFIRQMRCLVHHLDLKMIHGAG